MTDPVPHLENVCAVRPDDDKDKGCLCYCLRCITTGGRCICHCCSDTSKYGKDGKEREQSEVQSVVSNSDGTTDGSGSSVGSAV